ncbi:unnamed protein product [marine sediment metagenome]|uniref:Uncharacterized protein n=1 Tax=marine sediment metagenome TaxID=412755 RepID=X1V3D6_9ZZZZ
MDGHDSPVKMPELNLIPETDRGIELDKGMKQVMSLLTAYWRERRVTLQSTPSGSLFTCNPEIKDIFHVPADGDGDVYQGDDIQCSEVMVMAHPSNGNTIWVRPHKIATVDNAWPLLKYDVVSFTITNLNMLHILIETSTERAIIAYTM